MSQQEADPWDETVERKPPKGLLGWLLLPLLQLIATPVLLVLAALGRLKTHHPADDLRVMMGDYVFLVLANLVMVLMAAQVLFGLYCLVQFIRRKTQVPRLMTIWYGMGVALCVLLPAQFAVDPDMFVKLVDENATSSAQGFSATMNIAILGLGLLYFGISKRVKNTFVR